MSDLRPIAVVKINGIDARFIVDSGAFFNVITPGGAAKFKMQAEPSPVPLSIEGVGGGGWSLDIAKAKDFTFAGATYHRVEFSIGQRGFGDDLAGLLGQNLLGVGDVEYDLANGVIRLFRPEGCENASMAYWAKPDDVSEIDIDPNGPEAPHTKGHATLNGVKINVEFDTGSPLSMLSVEAAARAGVKPSSPGVVADGYTEGVALHSYQQTWIAPFATFGLGGEEIRNTRLRFGDMKLGDETDMLIGADFFLSHHVYVSNRQHRLYFTYNGGPVFNLGANPRQPAGKAAEAGADSGAGADAPTDAAGFERRAAAFASRRDYAHAIADLSRAMDLAPNEPRYPFLRGLAESALGQKVPALADYDRALKQKPGDVAALLARAEVHVADGASSLAQSDLDAAAAAAASDPDQRLGIADAYGRAGLLEPSIAQLDQWIDAHPKDDRRSEALNMRCWSRALLGRGLDQALADCNAALKISPGDPRALDSRGLVRLRMGDLDGSIADYGASLRIDPRGAWSLYGRGLARLKKGQASDGEADIAAATALQPGLPAEAKARGLTP